MSEELRKVHASVCCQSRAPPLEPLSKALENQNGHSILGGDCKRTTVI